MGSETVHERLINTARDLFAGAEQDLSAGLMPEIQRKAAAVIAAAAYLEAYDRMTGVSARRS